jgi:hypothetical protein
VRTFGVVSAFTIAVCPLPLALLLFDSSGGVLFLLMVGIETALWTLGVVLLSGQHRS